MSQINENGYEVGKCWECLTELEMKRLSTTEKRRYLCPKCVREEGESYNIVELADEVNSDEV